MSLFFVAMLITVALVGLVWLGYWMATKQLRRERAEINTQRQVLGAEWTTLEQTRRVNDVFFRARDAMRRTADGGS